MSNLSVETDAVRTFAAENAGIAGEVAGAGNFDAAASVAALTPVFGLIGADYLLSFAAAQVLQARDINDLSAKYAKLSDAAFTSAAQYDQNDFSRASDFGRTAGEIGGIL